MAAPSLHPPYSSSAASSALVLLRQAFDRWSTTEAAMLASGKSVRTALEMHGEAVAVLMWAAALDDMCGKDPQPLPAYLRARTGDVAELLDAARYARNRAVHQLIALADPDWVLPAAPWVGSITSEPRPYRWAPMHFMPDPAEEHPSQTRLRAAYSTRWACKAMSPGLAELRAWFDANIPL